MPLRVAGGEGSSRHLLCKGMFLCTNVRIRTGLFLKEYFLLPACFYYIYSLQVGYAQFILFFCHRDMMRRHVESLVFSEMGYSLRSQKLRSYR
jgi:hypothetical protein